MTPKNLALKHVAEQNAKWRDVVDVKCPLCHDTHKITFGTLIRYYMNNKEEYKCKFCNGKKYMSIAKKIALGCILEADQNLKLKDSITAVCSVCRQMFTKKFKDVIKCCKNQNGPYKCRVCSNREIQSRSEVKNKTQKSLLKNSSSNRVKELWRDNNFRAKVSKNIKRHANSPKGRKQRSKQANEAWASPEYKKIISQHSKLNYNRNMFTEEVRSKLSKSTKRLWKTDVRNAYLKGSAKGFLNSQSPTSIEIATRGVLKNLGVHFIEQHKVGRYFFDFYAPDHSVLIEVNGDYWHNLPKNKKRDKLKSKYARIKHPDYTQLVIWEHEFRDLKSVKVRIVAALEESKYA